MKKGPQLIKFFKNFFMDVFQKFIFNITNLFRRFYSIFNFRYLYLKLEPSRLWLEPEYFDLKIIKNFLVSNSNFFWVQDFSNESLLF